MEELLAYLKQRIEATAETADHMVMQTGRSASASYHIGAEEAYQDAYDRLRSILHEKDGV